MQSPDPHAIARRLKACWRCDFSSGYRGMDRCHVCDGTGQVYEIGVRAGPDVAKTVRMYPGTPEGEAQVRAIVEQEQGGGDAG